MGGQLYTVLLPSVPEAQPQDDVRSLFLHLDEADELAREIGVTPLSRFLGDLLEGEIETWHSVEDGLHTIRALAAAVRDLPIEPGDWAYNIDHEFSALEASLLKAAPSAQVFCLIIG